MTGIARDARRTLAVCAACLTILPSCTSRNDNELPDESVGVAQQPLFESACWASLDGGPGASADATVIAGTNVCSGFCLPKFFGATTHTPYNDPYCPQQYIVEVTNTLNKKIKPVAPWLWSTANSDWCGGFWVSMKAKGFKNNAWWDLGTYTKVGSYNAEFFRCDAVMSSGSEPIVQATNHGYTKARTVVQTGWVYYVQPDASAGIEVHP